MIFNCFAFRIHDDILGLSFSRFRLMILIVVMLFSVGRHGHITVSPISNSAIATSAKMQDSVAWKTPIPPFSRRFHCKFVYHDDCSNSMLLL